MKNTTGRQASGRRTSAFLISGAVALALLALLIGRSGAPRWYERHLTKDGEQSQPGRGSAADLDKQQRRGVELAQLEQAIVDQTTTRQAAVADKAIVVGGAPVPRDAPTNVREERPANEEELAALDKMMDAQAGSRAAIPSDPNIMAGILNTLRSGVTPTLRFGLVQYYKDMVRSMPEDESTRALADLDEAIKAAH